MTVLIAFLPHHHVAYSLPNASLILTGIFIYGGETIGLQAPKNKKAHYCQF
jgi:hypothetical protein